MKISLIKMKRGMKTLMIILLLSVFGMTKANAQTPYRQYADNGILLNFHEIDNVDFRVFLLYNLNQGDRFVLIENEESGQFSIIANDEMDATDFYDAFETFYQNAYTDFQLLSKTDVTDQLPQWKSLVAPQHFTSIMMDVTLRRTRSGDNEQCINAVKICTSEVTEYEAATTTQTADQLEGHTIEDGCIGASYNPSWYYLKIADPGQFIIHIEGHDPDNSSTQRDIDFCLWGPYTEEQFVSSYVCTHLTGDKIIDCSYSSSYIENAYLGYLGNQHYHTSSHGTINYHEPQTGEYYFLMITNYSRQPCAVTFTKEEGSGPGTADCSLLPPVVGNDGPYCVGETIYLSAIPFVSGCSYNWTGPSNFRSRYQNPTRWNCTMAMAGPYICTITRNGQTASDTTWVEVYPTPVADFTATTVSLGNATQFTSTSTTNPTGYSISTYEWDYGDGYTGSGATTSHYYGQAGYYQVTLTVTTDGHCNDEITQTVTVNESPTGIISFADANVKTLCVAHWDTNGDGELSYAEATAVTSLGEVFKNNSNITSFNELRYFIGLTSIGNNAFKNCFNLTSMEFPTSMTSIGDYAFYYCSNLTSIELPNSVTSIGDGAFYNCTGLTSVEIPNSVNSMGINPFSNCSGLEQIVVVSGNPFYDSRNNCNAIIRTNTNSLVTGCKNTMIPNSVTSIGDNAFAYCSGLTGELVIPNSVISISNYAFSNCSGLTSLTIGKSVTSIGCYAFYSCNGITSMTVMANNPPAVLGFYVFNNVNTSIPVYVPCNSLSTYQFADGWKSFTNYMPAPGTTCDSGDITVTVNFEEGGTVSGAGYYEGGTTCTLVANANVGYTFLYWMENGEVVSKKNVYDFIVAGDRNLVANFDTNHWTPVDEGAYALSMTIYGVIQINGLEQYSDQLEVGVFCGNECRGSAIAHDFFLTHRYLTEVNVYGENGHQLTFKLYNHALQQELDLTPPNAITFSLDGYGDPINPYVMNFMGDIPLTFHFATNGNWSNMSNWKEGTLPGPNDRVVINADCGLNVNAIVSSLIVSAGNKFTLQSGKVLTVTGNLTNASAANLVIKDGAQLINASANVAATLEKSITSYGRDGSNNWYTIASPMKGMPIARSNFLTPSYDLYRYNETNITNEEWENYKANLADFTAFEKGRGYLYANNHNITPTFTGILNASAVTYSLTCTNRPNDPLSGFNLIGNPFPHNIYKGAGGAIDNVNLASGYYTLTNEGTWQAHTFEDAILPGQGILVKATDPTLLTIAKSNVAAGSESSEAERCKRSLCISVAGDNGQDQAYVYFGQGNDLDKVKSIATDAPSLAVRNGNGDFAIAHCDKKNDAVELVFTTPTDGSFTLTMDVAGADFKYLHLIDQLTGDDIDLLALLQAQEPASYSFEANPNDMASRFTIVYKVKE